MKPILSLIIPVYKAEDFIEACLNSVFSQLSNGVEVILIDDGTPDGSMEIVRHSFSKWIDGGQLVLLEQINMGPGAARNKGICKSRSDFIAFLDSDDVLLDGYFAEIVDHLKTGLADIIEFGFKRFTSQANLTKVPYRPLYNFEGLHRLADVREQVFSAGCWYPSTRVYRRQIFDHLLFPVATHYEDLMTIPFVYLQDLTVLFIDKPLLGYRYNPDSITSNHTTKQLSEQHKFYKSIPNKTGCTATKILKLKTVRGMVFFQSELSVPGFPIDELVEEIKQMKLGPSTCRYLRWSDWLFFHFPATYVLIDKVRVPAKKLLSKLIRLERTHLV